MHTIKLSILVNCISNTSKTEHTLHLLKQYVSDCEQPNATEIVIDEYSADKLPIAINNCKGEYIWLLNPEDAPKENGVNTILTAIDSAEFHFAILNADLCCENKNLATSIKSNSTLVHYNQGRQLFFDFGLTSLASITSCLLFKKNQFDQQAYAHYSAADEHLYAAAFADMYDAQPSLFISTPVLTHSKKSNHCNKSDYFSIENTKQSCAFAQQIQTLSKKTGQSIQKLLRNKEFNYNRDGLTAKIDTLDGYMARLFLNQLEQCVSLPRALAEATHQQITQILKLLQSSNQAVHEGLTELAQIALITIKQTNSNPIFNAEQIKKNICSWKKTLVTPIAHSNEEPKTQSPAIIYFDREGSIQLLSGTKVSNNKPTNKLTTPKLSILIPSLNRAKELDQTLNTLTSWLRHSNADNIEIVVALNACADNSKDILQIHTKQSSYIHAHCHENLVHSAEENISRSINLCNGEYIWTLGDDDYVTYETFLLLIHLVNTSTKTPAFIFNHAVANEDDRLDECRHINAVNHASKSNFSSIKYQHLVEQYGLTTTMAFISRYIIHKDFFSSYQDYVKVSPIYSHVFYFLENLHNAKVTWVNYPLIVRNDSEVADRIVDLAKHHDTNQFHLWSGGILKLYCKLIKQCDIEKQFLFNVTESHLGNSYKLSVEILQNIIRQLESYLENPASGRPVGSDIALYQSLSFYTTSKRHKRIMFITESLSNLYGRISSNNPFSPTALAQFKNSIEELTSYNLTNKNLPGHPPQDIPNSQPEIEKIKWRHRVPIVHKIGRRTKQALRIK